VTFVGGEHIRLGDDWEVEIVALPGHAKGHLGVLDAKNQALYGGDAIHGSVYLGFDGTPRLCPTYADLDDYLNTIRFIEHLPITTYVGCHWNVKHDSEIKDFCAESREFVLRADHPFEVCQRLRTLEELCRELSPKWGEWPRAVDLKWLLRCTAMSAARWSASW
jgi:glyoxylase-like metal-dependent hydrolase (beta-lactamase superfamily II)